MGKSHRRPEESGDALQGPDGVATTDRQQLIFDDGKSRKFWTIELDGAQHTVQFGRVDTTGQTQTKAFHSPDEARKSFDKLIAEKLKKGYHSAATGSSPSPAAAESATAGPAAAEAEEGPPASAIAGPKAEPAPAQVPAAPQPAAPCRAEVTHAIDLEPTDWLWATWRIGSPLPPPPKPRPGAEEESEENVLDEEDWAEDDFLRAQRPYHLRPIEKIILAKGARPELVPKVLDLIDKRSRAKSFLMDNYTDRDYADEFRRFILPRLTPKQLNQLRAAVRDRLAEAKLPAKPSERMPIVVYLAARLGLHAEIAEIVRGWDDQRFAGGHDHYQYPQTIVFGLGSPEEIVREMRRLRLRLHTIDDSYVRAWIACTEVSELGKVRDDVLAEKGRETCARMVFVLTLIRAPEVGETMLELSLTSKAPKMAMAWLESEVGNAIAGLIPTAAGRGKLAEPALVFLRQKKVQGYGAFIAACLEQVEPSVAAKIRAEVLEHVEPAYPVFDEATTPDWLRHGVDAERSAGAGPRPEWASPAKVPPLIADGHKLNDRQVEAVLDALARHDLTDRPPLLQSLRAHGDRDALDTFVWRLFEGWLQDGAPTKQGWAMKALGQLGSDAIALRLTPLVRLWPGESQHKRAVTGLECLRAIGTDTALMQLNGIAQKVKFKGLKARAEALMEEIAAERKLSRGELEDRIVPDLDLDARGTRVFDFGPRQFRFVLGPELKPMVRDESGALKPDLPKPGAKDDPALAGEAVEAWKGLKKQWREVAKVQAERLEQAMITGRRWPVTEFETLIVRHPLMTNFARLLIWGGYDAAGKLARTFRVTEDRAYADADDSACTLDGLASVGIVHPLHLTDEQRAAWGGVFGDYEIVPPFAQLGRAVYRLQGDEQQGREITRFRGIKIPAATLIFTLEKLGWLRATPKDNGTIDHHRKPFPGASVTAVVTYGYGGPSVNFIEQAPDQDIEHCYFLAGTDHSGNSWYDHPDFLKQALPLDQVDPVALSEVLGDLTTVAAKAKR